MKHKIKIITKPEIFLLGKTEINIEGVKDFQHKIENESGKQALMLDKLLDSGLDSSDKISEIAGRVCYQSYFKGRDSEEYMENILSSGHGSVLEHSWVNTILTGISRSMSHEIERHRVGTAISEMSQRFVGANEKSGIWNFVLPASLRGVWDGNIALQDKMYEMAENSVEQYLELKEMLKDNFPNHNTKQINEAAREVLPNWTETRMVWSFNMRQVRHILDKRGSVHADQQILDFSLELYDLLESLNILCLNDIEKTKGINNTLTMKYHGV